MPYLIKGQNEFNVELINVLCGNMWNILPEDR